MDLILQSRVLALNASWQADKVKTVKKAMEDMCCGAFLGLPLEEGDISGSRPLVWEEWVKLSPLEGEPVIHTPHGAVRVPTIIIAENYKRLHLREAPCTADNIFRRDKFICGYTGRKLERGSATVDHIFPKSRGGLWVWENLITCDKAVNQLKNDRTPEEAGLRLLFRPRKPAPMPPAAFIQNRLGIKAWDAFLFAS